MSYLAKEKFHLRASGEMLIARLVTNLGFALAAGVSSLYFNEVGLTNGQIGMLGGAASILVILLSPITPVLLERVNEIKLYIILGVLLGGVYALSGLSINVAWAAVALYIVSRTLIALLGAAGSIAFKDLQTSKKSYTKAQGVASSLMNLGWVIGPFMGGLILNAYGMKTTFVISGIVLALGSLLLFIYPIKLKQKKRATLDTSWKQNILFYMSRKGLKNAYWFRTCTTLWWGFVFTFMPLFMIAENYSVSNIGLFLTATQIPLFLFEFRTVDFIKPLGFRRIFLGSFGLLTVIMLGAVITNSLLFALIAIIVGSLALSFLEPVSEIYFYDQVTSLEEEQAYPIYNTANSAGSIAGRMLIGLILAVLATRYSYLAMAIMFVAVLGVAYRMPSKKR